MRIGVLGGSFNPPTNAHIELSNICIQKGLCEKVIWVPVNDSYKKATNIISKHRINMVKLALENEKDIDYSLHELEYNRIVRTLESLQILQRKLSNDNLYFIAGADKLVFKWMQREDFISQFGYILINRGDIDCRKIIESVPTLKKYSLKIQVLDYKSDVSSTIVREDIQSKGYSDLISENVLEYINKNNLYR